MDMEQLMKEHAEMYLDMYGVPAKGIKGTYHLAREADAKLEKIITAARWIAVGLGFNLVKDLGFLQWLISLLS